MIGSAPSVASLPGDERFGLDLLIDCSRLLRVDDPSARVARVDVTDATVDPWGAGGEFGIAASDGVVRVPRALLRWVTGVAGAAVEQHATERDRHSRVPSTSNPMVQAGREREPVVSLAAAALGRAAVSAAGGRPVRFLAPWPEGRRWAAAFTHDLDVVSRWPAFTLLRLAELLRKADVGRALAVTAAAGASIGGDPVWRAAESLVALERTHGIRSTWFVLCGTPTFRTMRAGDLTYVPESSGARRIVGAALAAGDEIGLHGSFATLASAPAFAEQRERLGRIAGRVPAGVRQHYIRMHPGPTQRAMATAGFTYDASFGFPDRNGFRLGAADITPGWDAESGSTTPLAEVPLTWMDRALSKYRGVEDPQAWVDDALALAARCREVEGLWVGLWHPNLSPPLGYPTAPAAYARVVDGVLRDAPYVAPVGELVRWRRARAAVRAASVAADGVVAAVPRALDPGLPLVLEDGAGQAREAVRVA